MSAYKVYLVLLSFIAAPSLYAQSTGKQVTQQQLVWYAYNNTLEFSPKWLLITEVHERRYMNPDAQHQFVTRSHLNYALGKGWNASAGFTYFLQSPQDPHAANKLVVPELRPHIQFDYKQSFSKLLIGHRYRIEKRFFRNIEDGELAEGYNTNYRFRYRLGLEYQLATIHGLPLKLKLNDEIHINAGERINYNRFDQNRIYVGLNYAIHKNVAFEAGYLKWYQQRASGNQYFSRDIISFSVYHKIDLKKKQSTVPEDVKQ
ncbi:DUF2490 domain-containing protein [Pontibacter pamirensis]|uniref:DUF2490 domain-containing protein n=1 Tax=Pontibacter pamirensis TaxID=2562824 RepID=UPI001389DA97|nr:DUF2490 domain-containing protein [Pontibacter pamirensis]